MAVHPGTPAALSIGAVLGDVDESNRRWKESISRVGLDVQEADRASAEESPLRLNVVFFTPGKYNTSPFEGVRTGRFSKKDCHLMVQASVPAGPVDDRRAVLLRLLLQAVEEAEAFSRKRGIAQSLDVIRAVAQRLG